MAADRWPLPEVPVEGLMLARAVSDLARVLPARTLGWAFPDETTSALLLEGAGNLVFSYRPPQPGLYLSNERLRGEPNNPFQRFLAARARGDLLSVEQLKLDRVVQVRFGGERGFVDQPPIRLLFELTGRNANLLAMEDGEGWEGRILLAAREIANSRNRFRTVRTGGSYTPPPPYQKLDPRNLTDAEAESLSVVPLSKWKDRVDGLGLLLSAELARRAGLPLDQPPGPAWPQVLAALQDLARDPTVSEGTLSAGLREAGRAEKAAQLRRDLREPLEKRRALLTNQLGDVERATTGLEEAEQERLEADLLMAYSHQVEPAASSVTLPDFSGAGERPIALDPQLSAVQNAEKRYARARRREEVFTRLAEREPQLRADLAEVEASLAALEHADLATLEGLERDLASGRTEKSPYGLRYLSPSGFEVLVGRNNKENAFLTHRLGKSMDFWFHVQGYPGSHVLVRSGGRDLQGPDILMAAGLAALHSKARASSNVPVDYTRIKHVWRAKGASAGQVQYTQQKTVFVDPEAPSVDRGS